MDICLKIVHIYPELLNLYGDGGNIAAMKYRLNKRGLSADICKISLGDGIDFSAADIVLLGGGTDKNQLIALEKLLAVKDEISSFVEDSGVLLAVCGGFTLLGNYCALGNEKIPALGILDINTEKSGKRHVGDIVLESPLFPHPIVGFENHDTETSLHFKHEPLGSVVHGFGNNGDDKSEGVLYKNVVATYLHGPLLPKNPALCDYILEAALERKAGHKIELEPLDDSAELAANKYIADRFSKRAK